MWMRPLPTLVITSRGSKPELAIALKTSVATSSLRNWPRDGVPEVSSLVVGDNPSRAAANLAIPQIARIQSQTGPLDREHERRRDVVLRAQPAETDRAYCRRAVTPLLSNSKNTSGCADSGIHRESIAVANTTGAAACQRRLDREVVGDGIGRVANRRRAVEIKLDSVRRSTPSLTVERLPVRNTARLHRTDSKFAPGDIDHMVRAGMRVDHASTQVGRGDRRR